MPVLQRLVDRLGIAGDLLRYFWRRKLWWMVPLVIVMLCVGILLVVAVEQAAIAPFIYVLF